MDFAIREDRDPEGQKGIDVTNSILDLRRDNENNTQQIVGHGGRASLGLIFFFGKKVTRDEDER